MSTQPLAWAASCSASHSATVSASGFSTITCLPACSASRANGKCMLIGSAITTAWMSSSASTSAQVLITGTDGYCARARLRDSGLTSQMATSSVVGLDATLRARFGPQYPYPTMQVGIRLGVIMSAPCVWLTPAVMPAAAGHPGGRACPRDKW